MRAQFAESRASEERAPSCAVAPDPVTCKIPLARNTRMRSSAEVDQLENTTDTSMQFPVILRSSVVSIGTGEWDKE